jgi:thiol-disulfide isomerase/thioredoxin
MTRSTILIVAFILGAFLIASWLALGTPEPMERNSSGPFKIQTPTPRTAKNFALHPAPKPLPKVVFRNGDGRQTSLAEFHGKTVLLNVWATWCGPCRREMPTLDRLQGILGGADFEVLALSIDRAGPEAVREFYRKIGIKNLSLYVDSSGKASGALGVVGIPATLLVDPNGKEIGRLVGPADWDTPEMVAYLKAHLDRSRGGGDKRIPD